MKQNRISQLKASLESEQPALPDVVEGDDDSLYQAISDNSAAIAVAEESAAALESIAMDLQTLLDRGGVSSAERGLTTTAVNRHMSRLGEPPIDPMGDLVIAQESIGDTIGRIWEKIKELARKAWALLKEFFARLTGSKYKVVYATREKNFNDDKAKVEESLKKIRTDFDFQVTIPKGSLLNFNPSTFSVALLNAKLKDFIKYMEWFQENFEKDRSVFMKELEQICRKANGISSAGLMPWITEFKALSPRNTRPMVWSLKPADVPSEIPAVFRNVVKTTRNNGQLLLGSMEFLVVKPTRNMVVTSHNIPHFMNSVFASYFITARSEPSTEDRVLGLNTSYGKDLTDVIAYASGTLSNVAKKLRMTTVDLIKEKDIPRWLEDLDKSFIENIRKGDGSEKYEQIYH
ncbi:MAG: hypothetical protein CL678_15455 [Bdellovibrionaceae bacterium]|nr:hypothetical protein [Pseudobdellovibrionaceae bacterium]